MGDFFSGRFFTLTDVGKVRNTNEDFADVRANAFGQIIMVVADGMGGQSRGDFASNTIGKGIIKDFLDFGRPLLKVNKRRNGYIKPSINIIVKYITKPIKTPNISVVVPL